MGEDHGYTALRCRRLGGVLEVTLDHPELNAIDGVLHHDLTTLFGRLRREREAGAAVLTDAGRAFSAGGDYSWFPELQQPGRLESLRQDARSLIWDLLDVEIPVVAAVNGPAMGLGATIALLCDVIVMADTAVIGDPHVRVGLVAGDGGTAIWPLAVGPAVAKRHLLTGDPLNAVEAQRIGLVTDVVPAAEVVTRSTELAGRLAAMAPLAVRYTKLAINNLVKETLTRAFEVSLAYELITLRSRDHAEALAAIGEHRDPVFEGR
jgi:enoyl-CoA hydratase